MSRNKLVVTSNIIIITAWIVLIPGIYLLYDFWIRFLNGIIMRQIALRPYGVWIGTCPFLFFWIASIIATAMSYWGLKQLDKNSNFDSDKLLLKRILTLGGVGVFIGTFLGVPVLLVMFLVYITGHF